MSELNVLQRTEHKNLMKLIEVLEDEQTFYLVCELMNGGDLGERLKAVR